MPLVTEELPAALAKEHAEVTALEGVGGAAERGLSPAAIGTTWNIAQIARP